MKIRQVGADCSMRTGRRTDRQTYMKNLVLAFRNFANATKVKPT